MLKKMQEDNTVLNKKQEYGAVLSNGIGSKLATYFNTSEMQLPKNKATPAGFEQAIKAAGFGKFNYILLLLAWPSSWASMFATTNISYVIPAALCDLNLTLVHMGMLNASPFVGMIISAFFWGYLADTLGRRQILIYGFIADSVCNVICALSYNVWMLATMKFIGGFIVAGPFAVLMSYLSEFHSSEHRSRIIIATGIYAGTVNLFLPMLAWIIMSLQDMSLFSFVIYPWQIYILICAIPSMVAGLAFLKMPETPKFLMMIGKYDEALSVLRRMYSVNNNKPENTYPISELLINSKHISLNLVTDIEKSTLEEFKKGWRQITPLFRPPYLWLILLILFIQFCTLLGANTLRLWLPQLFTSLDEYEQNYGYNLSANICEMLNYATNKTTAINTLVENMETCTIVHSNPQVYISSAIVGTFSILVYAAVALIINKVNKTIFLALIYLLSGACGIALIWASNPLTMLTLSSMYTALAGVAVVTIVSIVVELFPTSLRTMTVSLTMMMGRVGTILGNVLFPILLISGCIPPFLLIGGTLVVCIIPLLMLPSCKSKEEDELN